MNTYGNKFKLSIFGESHGNTIGVVLDGVPAGIDLCKEDFMEDLGRRKSGAKGTTPRIESDMPEIVSGIFEGHTTGAPIAVLFTNENTKSGDYSSFRELPRPGHADFTASAKYNFYNDIRGGGHFSGRLTLALVAAGVVAKKMIAPIKISASISSLGGIPKEDNDKWETLIQDASHEGDSVGGVIECICEGVPVGLGEPFFDSIESQIAHLAFSIPGVRGVEFGDGFAASAMRGSQHNDPFVDTEGTTSKNGCGGINGGISNGNPITFRVAIKPTSSISKEQTSFNFITEKMESFSIPGRHDTCIALRCSVIVEAIAAIVLANN